jgi:hypothetical protein
MFLWICSSSGGQSEAEERMLYHDWVARVRDRRTSAGATASGSRFFSTTLFMGLTHDEFSAHYVNDHHPTGTALDKDRRLRHANAPVHDHDSFVDSDRASVLTHWQDYGSLVVGTVHAIVPDEHPIPPSVDWTAGAGAPVKSQGLWDLVGPIYKTV